jgi:paraquat-inducible protein A
MSLPPVAHRAPALGRPQPGLLACDQCDALYHRPSLASSEQSRCRRCGALLGRGHRISLQSMLALSITALVVFLIANLQPVVELNLQGVHNSASLPDALRLTWRSGEHSIALLAAASAFVFPLAVILLRLYVLTPVWARRLPPLWTSALRALMFASRWSMIEVLLLAALVSIVRIAAMASAIPGIGLYAFGVLALLLAGLESAGLHRLWDCLDLYPTAPRRP